MITHKCYISFLSLKNQLHLFQKILFFVTFLGPNVFYLPKIPQKWKKTENCKNLQIRS